MDNVVVVCWCGVVGGDVVVEFGYVGQQFFFGDEVWWVGWDGNYLDVVGKVDY